MFNQESVENIIKYNRSASKVTQLAIQEKYRQLGFQILEFDGNFYPIDLEGTLYQRCVQILTIDDIELPSEFSEVPCYYKKEFVNVWALRDVSEDKFTKPHQQFSVEFLEKKEIPF